MNKKLTKAENAAIHCVEKLYREYVNPGKYKPRGFNINTFNIKEYAEGFIILAYNNNRIPHKSRQRALNLAETYWNEKCNKGKNK